jgi:hypothetical protein
MPEQQPPTQEQIDEAIAHAQSLIREAQALPKEHTDLLHQRVHGMQVATLHIQKNAPSQQEAFEAYFALLEGELNVAFVLGMRYQKSLMMN